MGNEHTDARTWPDDVETYPATAQDLAAYAHSRHTLAQFQAPLLVSQQNPHTRLFVACFDGTGNDKHKDPKHITNIGILDDQVHAAEKAGVRNIAGYYVPGIGTQDDALTRNLDGALGYSYGPRMEEMYLKFIRQAKQWRDQDPQVEISIVSTGFSRGAVTAAMFTRMVHERGIQSPVGMNIEQGPHGEILKLTPTHPPLVPPGRTAQTVGLLDPVATGDMNLHDVRLPPSVVSGLQLTARDERRDLFPAKDILHPGHSHDGRFLNLTHPGAHSDIGGSYRLDGLSVRNGNLLTDYVNSLSDKPFLQPRTVPSAPEMNVIHRSEQHGSYYTTTMATTLGHRVHVHNLDGTGMTQAPNDAQSLDAGLRAHLPLRPVAVSPERTDPALPAFFREGPHPHPHALAAPPLPAYLQQGAMPHVPGAPSTQTTPTNADASSSSSSAAASASTPPRAMDRQQQDHAAQQHHEQIQQAQQQAAHLAQAHRQTQPLPSHSAPVHEKPASVDMQEQARIAQLQQQEQQAQAAREQQHQLAQQHAQLHLQTMDARQHEQRQAAEPMLYTPPTRTPRSDDHLQDFRQPDHPMHSRYTQFKNALEQSHTLPINGDKLPYGPAQQERLAAGFTDALGIDPHYEHSIRGFKQHQGQLLAYDQPCSFTEKSNVLRIDPEQALAKSPEQHAASWKAREASHPEPPSRVIAPITVTAEDMRHPAHPRHAMFEQARSAIANANERWGRPAPDPEQLDRHAAHVVVESRKFGHTEVERVHLGMPQGHATQTPNYAVQSEGKIVARIFAPELAQAPSVAQASQQLQTVEQQNLAEQAMQAQRAAQMQGQGMVMKM
ncbi:DUF2235 domain-containing protein [Xanthomonas sp. GPE 39]|uniref:T6SS phospholipase effector Tle1-like catalytic domain-containing protein n=1 Tax=Xanthomonas sp. GPE 39 TaxID=1583099 RepID=UPI000A53930F|nr:DUF2235 domain-containing protein [Xanthomonas sp. GPE 39]